MLLYLSLIIYKLHSSVQALNFFQLLPLPVSIIWNEHKNKFKIYHISDTIRNIFKPQSLCVDNAHSKPKAKSKSKNLKIWKKDKKQRKTFFLTKHHTIVLLFLHGWFEINRLFSCTMVLPVGLSACNSCLDRCCTTLTPMQSPRTLVTVHTRSLSTKKQWDLRLETPYNLDLLYLIYSCWEVSFISGQNCKIYF